MNTANTQRWKDISIPVYVCVMLFATSSWIDVVGLYSELPLLVNKLPENWTLPSYMTITVQISNVGPLLYVIANHYTKAKVSEIPVIYLIIIIGVFAFAFLIPFWDKTVYVLGQERSVIFLLLTGLLSIVDCTSSVVYLAYMKRLKIQYVPAFYFGQSLCGFIPGCLGILQGVGGSPECLNVTAISYNDSININQTEWIIKPVYPSPRFSMEVFMGFICAMLCISGVSFGLLHIVPYFKIGYVESENENVKIKNKPLMQIHPSKENKNNEIESFISGKQEEVSTIEIASDRREQGEQLKWKTYIYLLILTSLLNALANGIFPSIRPYSCLPYSQLAYSLVVQLSKMVDLMVCFLVFFVPTESIRRISALTAILLTCAGFLVYLAFQSPSPPLQNHIAGDIMVVCVSVGAKAIMAYCEIVIAIILRKKGPPKALMWCGFFTQIGVFCGAVTTFLVINVFVLFTRQEACSV